MLERLWLYQAKKESRDVGDVPCLWPQRFMHIRMPRLSEAQAKADIPRRDDGEPFQYQSRPLSKTGRSSEPGSTSSRQSGARSVLSLPALQGLRGRALLERDEINQSAPISPSIGLKYV